MRKYLVLLTALLGLGLASCAGSIKPQVGAAYKDGDGKDAFIGLGLGEATWSTVTPEIGRTDVKVNLTPLYAVLAGIVLFVGYKMVKGKKE